MSRVASKPAPASSTGRSGGEPDAPPLTEEIVSALEERGLPQGAWLVDVVRVRQALRDADTLLRRLEEAIIRAASAAPRDAL